VRPPPPVGYVGRERGRDGRGGTIHLRNLYWSNIHGVMIFVSAWTMTEILQKKKSTKEVTKTYSTNQMNETL
jgi:hypothetical protein